MLLFAAVAQAQTQWVVDAAGGGDFTSLQTAIDAAAPGDVLLVQPGSYGVVNLEKRLRLLGNPTAARPVTTLFEIADASSFVLSHFQVGTLRVNDVNGQGVIDGCSVGFNGVRIENCASILMSRTTVAAGGAGIFAETAVEVRGSNVQVVGCDLAGGTALPAFEGTVGGDGLRLTDGSHAWISASTLRGGDGHDLWSVGSTGEGGDALSVYGGSIADVRGNAQHVLQQGKKIGPLSGGLNGWAIRTGTGGVAIVSGVTLIGPSLSQPHSLLPAPFLAVVGPTGPGETAEAHLYGELGEYAVLVAGLKPSALELPLLLSTPLWVDPGQWIVVAPLALQGLDTPAAFPLLQPPTSAFAGVTLHLQGFQLLPSGSVYGTNAASLVSSW